MDRGVIVMNMSSIFPKAPGLEPHHQVVNVISRTLVRRKSYPSAEMQSQILQPQWLGSDCFWQVGKMVRVFTNGPEGRGLGSIPGRVILKTKKMVLDSSLVNTHDYSVRIRGKWTNPGKGVVPSCTYLCSNYWKGRLCVILDYGQLTY